MSDNQCRFPVDTGKEIVDCILPVGHTGSHVHARRLAMLIQDAALEVRRRRKEETEKLLDALRAIVLTGDDDMINDEDARRAMYYLAQAAIDRSRASQADKGGEGEL